MKHVGAFQCTIYHVPFTRIEHILNHKESFNKFRIDLYSSLMTGNLNQMSITKGSLEQMSRNLEIKLHCSVHNRKWTNNSEKLNLNLKA